ncbi:hypothetical protein [Actinokineospora sp.]|uniref:hypothetical protein n=1 Tax=Actinokineospora sp. TaxID=1872133 RepID=UPI004037DFE5
MMAGDIWITRETRWAANSSLYHWVLDFLIDHLDDPATVAGLEEIRDNNLGLVCAEDFPSPARVDLISVIRDQLVSDAETRLPGNMAERDEFITELRRLAHLADITGTQK